MRQNISQIIPIVEIPVSIVNDHRMVAKEKSVDIFRRRDKIKINK